MKYTMIHLAFGLFKKKIERKTTPKVKIWLDPMLSKSYIKSLSHLTLILNNDLLKEIIQSFPAISILIRINYKSLLV